MNKHCRYSIWTLVICFMMAGAFFSCNNNEDPVPVPMPDIPVPVDPVQELLDNLVTEYATPLGISISSDQTPHIFALIQEAMNQCLDNDPVVTNEERAKAGWITAMLLVEIKPARQNEVLTKGYQLGIVSQDFGKHIDGNAAFRASSLHYAILHTAPAFLSLIEKAKTEVVK